MKEAGYEGELHHVTTEDGYILGLQRIIRNLDNKGENKKKESDRRDGVNSNKNRPPILFIHGLESSAIDWIHLLGKNSLPYIFFEQGYDVWLGNIRGTHSSFNHTSLDPYKNAEKFWDTSVHEVGYYDLPAMIDYVTNVSKREKIFYLGMSQGEASFLILTSTRPEYNKKIQLAGLTAPSSHLKHSDNTVLKTLGSIWPQLQVSANAVGLYQIPGRDFFGYFCQYELFSQICRYISVPFLGYADNDQVELKINTRLFEIYPTRSSFKQFLHYIQMYNSGKFRRFDYGKEENLKRYSNIEPPEYDLKKITAPIAYFWGENDCWSRPKDVEDIEKKLPNLVLSYRVPYKLFNHYDIMIATDAKKLVYDKIIETFKKYN
ncbi:hypothetical protein HHI36_010342 [Cryptolaemus montrouzieri]|uniref:Lipase n=1 Tax=Cryptolaemus montrouzieri TaxID=559131 RepID=A0ABD2MIX1_9CUCU